MTQQDQEAAEPPENDDPRTSTERLYEIALRNIARGHWNAGRLVPISAEDYAAQFLPENYPFRLPTGGSAASEVQS